MKRFLVVLAFCFAGLQVSSTDESDQLKECLTENGLPTTIFKEVGRGDFKALDDVPENKIACVIACSFNKRIKEKVTLYGPFMKAVNMDKQLSENKKKEMLETLNSCNTQAGVDNCKFLHCIKITKPPFDKLIVAPADKDN